MTSVRISVFAPLSVLLIVLTALAACSPPPEAAAPVADPVPTAAASRQALLASIDRCTADGDGGLAACFASCREDDPLDPDCFDACVAGSAASEGSCIAAAAERNDCWDCLRGCRDAIYDCKRDCRNQEPWDPDCYDDCDTDCREDCEDEC